MGMASDAALTKVDHTSQASGARARPDARWAIDARGRAVPPGSHRGAQFGRNPDSHVVPYHSSAVPWNNLARS